MGLPNFSIGNSLLELNGGEINDWGQTDPAVTFEYIDPAAVLRKGLGGKGLRIDSVAQGVRVTLNLNPGGTDSATVNGYLNSKEDMTLSHTALGTLETLVLTEGAVVNRGTIGRYGNNISDDQYILEFIVDVTSLGGTN